MVQYITVLPQLDCFIGGVFVNLWEPDWASVVRDITTDKISKRADCEDIEGSSVECIAICDNDFIRKRWYWGLSSLVCCVVDC